MSFFGSHVPMEYLMYGAIGFFAAWLMAFALLPLVHGRAERLLRKRFEDVPLSIKEMNAEKDQIRAGFAAATRSLELNLAQLREKTAIHATDLAKKVQLIARLKEELGAVNAALADSESRELAARSEARAARRELAVKDSALHAAEREIAAIKTEIGRIAPRLQPYYPDVPSAEIVPLAPVRQALDVAPAPNRLVPPPIGNGHAHGDEHVLRARAEIEDAARRVDARSDDVPSHGRSARTVYTPLFRSKN